MSKQLDNEDGRAVDLFFESRRPDGQEYTVQFNENPVDPARVRAAEKILSMLDGLSAPEPSANLIARTLQRVAADSHRVVHPENTRPDQRPLA